MLDLTFQQVLGRGIAAIVVLTVLGFALAIVGRLLGDKGVAYDGKIAPNPMVHIDIFGLVAAIAGRIGWVKPVAIDPKASSAGRLAPVLVAVGAAVLVLVFSRLVLLLLPLVASYWPSSSAGFVDWTIREIPQVAAWSIALNIIPLPPFLGGYALQAIAPAAYAWVLKRQLWVSIAALLLIIFFQHNLSQTPFETLAKALMTGAV